MDVILKPDTEDYDPFRYFEYGPLTHMFVAHSELDVNTKAKVENMIEVLGINHRTIRGMRKESVSRTYDSDGLEPSFPTAREFYRRAKLLP